MLPRQRVIVGLAGQVLVVDKLEAGRPDSAPTFELHDPQELPQTVIPGSVASVLTLDAMTTALAAPAGPTRDDPTLAIVDAPVDGSIIVGRPYLLTGAAGQSEWVIFARVDGTSCYTTRPLAFDYDTDDTLASSRVELALDAALFATGGYFATASANSAYLGEGYYLRLRYAVGGVPKSLDVFFDVVRQELDLGITGEDIEAAAPGITSREPESQRGSGWAPQRRIAAQRLDADLRSVGFRVDLVRGRDWFQPMALALTLSTICSGGIAPGNLDPERERDRYDKEYQRFFDRLTVSPLRENYDANDDGTIEKREAPPPRSSLLFQM